MELTVACADVGSVKSGNFGWAIRDVPGTLVEVPSGASITEFTDTIVERLKGGNPVALGFECPLFIPVREDPLLLTSARCGEGNRAWSASAGTGSLAIGIVQSTWILTRIRQLVNPAPIVTFSWSEFASRKASLFLWEAFVSGRAKTDSHHNDAGAAVNAFCSAYESNQLEQVNAVNEMNVLSLIGAALLRSGYRLPNGVLSHSCLVVKA